jgi:hypothetical protein
MQLSVSLCLCVFPGLHESQHRDTEAQRENFRKTQSTTVTDRSRESYTLLSV